MSQPRKRGVLLNRFNHDQLAESGKAEFGVPVGSIYDLGIAEHGGDLYVICHEGVGWKITEETPLRLNVFERTETGLSMIPAGQMVLGPDSVRRYRLDELVDLADFVRVFGGRLEGNFALWRDRLGG